MKLPHSLYENGFDYIRLEDLQLKSQLPEYITIEDEKMVKKPEFHISLVWVGRLSEIVDAANKGKVKRYMIEEFEKFIAINPLDVYELTGELRLVKNNGLKTVIAMAKVPNLEKFFDKLSEKYGVRLPMQPAHITLYTLPSDKVGIGILSDEELQNISEPVNIPGLQSLL